jgi:uncharacterized protein YbjT (DUF2867 family)
MIDTLWLAGASGLVGGAVLERLLGDAAFARIVSTARRALPREHPKLVQATVSFTDAATFAELPAPQVAFCCLGTTIKKAGSPAAFRAVDHDAVVLFAKAARDKGARVFVHVSSLGADARSRTLYSSVKGQVEEAVSRLGFDSVVALRPSILDGDRADSRPLERLGLAFGRALGPVLGKYRPTPADAVAEVMVALAKSAPPGASVVEADALWRRSPPMA